MKKLVSDLMIVNKIVIFLENLIDEDADIELFSSKIVYDVDFVTSLCGAVFDEYILNARLYNNENILKLYFSSLKRIHKLILKLKKRFSIFDKKSKEFLDSLNETIEGKINRIKDIDYRENIVKYDKQTLNEEEYHLLLGTN